MKKSLTLILLIIICMFLAGCWNYREIESLSIIAGVAVERDPKNDDFILYIEIIEAGGSTQEQTMESKIIESRGETMFDAVRSAINASGKRLYWSHAQIVIISEDIAREGILEVLDWFYRDAEPRLTLHLMVARDASPKDIISSTGITNKIRSFEIDDKIENGDSVAKYAHVDLYEAVKMLRSQVSYAYLPSITTKKQDEIEISEICGTAVFKGDKLVGFLDMQDTKYFLFIIDEIQGGLLVNKNVQDNPDANISLEVFDSKTKVKPVYSEGKITISIQIKTEVAIGECGPHVNMGDKSGVTKIKEDMQEFLEENIVRVIHKVQSEYDSDIFGFGQLIYQEMPDVWEQYKDNWDDEFKDLTLQVSSEIMIRNAAHSTKSLTETE